MGWQHLMLARLGVHVPDSTLLSTVSCHFLEDEAATVAAGQQLGQCCHGGLVIFLEGTLGAGKTTLTRGILMALGYSGAVKSPTYTLVEPYENLSPTVYHFDLYRLGDPEELGYMGIRDYFSSHSLCLLEWADKGQGYLPKPDMVLSLQPCEQEGSVGRQLQIEAFSKAGQLIVDQLDF